MGCEKLKISWKKLVLTLSNSIYGLKQAAISWWEKVANFLTERNFVLNQNDYCLFGKNEKDSKQFVINCNDDRVNTGSSSKYIEELRKFFETKYKTDDRGKFEWFLGMQVNEDSEKTTLDQETILKVS